MSRVDFIREIPKIELHAHLSGSVRDSTIIDLLRQKLLSQFRNQTEQCSEELIKAKADAELKRYEVTANKSLKQCFEIFGLLHSLLSTKSILRRVTEEILCDFAADNCAYLELRTTPRNVYEAGTNSLLISKQEYIETVLECVREFEAKSDMIVRLLLSVDRTGSVEDALDTLQLCAKCSDGLIVGVDFSGNPHDKSFREFHQVFDLIKAMRLSVTVHTAEIWDDKDVEYVLKEIRPDRIGHAVCLSDEAKAHLLKSPIPIEICPTSNLITKCVQNIQQHPFYDFYKVDKNYPLVICTDDCGIFNTSLTREQHLIASAFSLGDQQMFALNLNAVNYIFDKSEQTRLKLFNKFDEFKKKKCL